MDRFVMSREIVEEYYGRVLRIKKYYPFFQIMDGSLAGFQDGKYADLDPGYVTMALLRFLIEENNFREKAVTYDEVEEFLGELYRRDFLLALSPREEKELSAYLFDRIKNEGKPFSFLCYDPVEHVRRQLRIRLIEGKMVGNVVQYSITRDGLEFYLDTKELPEESTISIEQLLLEKMIRSRNFKGGTMVVQRINNEVDRLRLEKNEVLDALSRNVFDGIAASESFMERTTKWFEQEQKLFDKNVELIRLALSRAREDESAGDYQSQYYRAMEEIRGLDLELQRAIRKHGELLGECMDLQNVADELVRKARLRSLRRAFDFEKMGEALLRQDRADWLESFVMPLLKPKIEKNFSPFLVDEILSFQPNRDEPGEQVEEREETEYVFEDEREEERMYNNFRCFLMVLADLLEKTETISLGDFVERLQRRYGEGVKKSSDLYVFLVHLCQKKEYHLAGGGAEKDTFLEGIMAECLSGRGLPDFVLEMHPEQTVLLGNGVETTDFLVRRMDGGRS